MLVKGNLGQWGCYDLLPLPVPSYLGIEYPRVRGLRYAKIGQGGDANVIPPPRLAPAKAIHGGLICVFFS